MTGASLRGIACMIGAAGAFVGNDTLMKIAMAELPPLQVLFLRGVAASLWCLPMLALLGHGGRLGSLADAWVLVRAACEVVAVMAFVIALAKMPIGDLTALVQITPLLVLIGVAVLWREPIGPARLALIILGFTGAVLVAQPGTGTASLYAALGVAAALGSAARDLAARRIPPDVPVLVATFTTLIVVMAAAGLGTALVERWTAPQRHHLLLIAAAGFLLIFGHVFIFLAFRLASARTVAPFYYSFTVWAVLSGLLVFGNVPNALAALGMACIVASGTAIVIMDSRRLRDPAGSR